MIGIRTSCRLCFVSLLVISIIQLPVSLGLTLTSSQRGLVRLTPTFEHVIGTGIRSHRNRYSLQSNNNLRMHMGHSHSHHSHGHGLDSSPAPSTAVPPTSQSIARRRIRRYAWILCCAFAILGPPLLQQKRALKGTDYMVFALTTASFRLLDPLRREVQHAIHRIRMLGSGIAKHAPPPKQFFGLTKVLFSSNADDDEDKSSADHAADRVTVLGGVMNLVLSLAKFIVGITCHSSALIADAGHSLSDLFSDFITLWAVQVGRLPPDDDHPYGHGKFEAIGSLFLALTLLGTGISVGAMSNKQLIEIITAGGATSSAPVLLPTFPALVMAGISILSKEWLFRITRSVGERLNSQVVIANAWHHRSDAYSSILAMVSIGMAMAGLKAADAAAGLLVAGMICMTGAEIMGESVKQLTDTTDERLVKTVIDIAANSKDVASVNRVRARQVGSSSMIDVSVSMPEDMASSQARAIEERLKARILQEEGVLDVDVKATSPEIVCPLLAKQQNASGENADTTYNIISKSEVESCVRDEILRRHPEVLSVQGVTVHYQDIVTNPINVDVDISIQDTHSTIAKASELAENVKQTLERSAHIHQANIYLDLTSIPRVMVQP